MRRRSGVSGWTIFWIIIAVAVIAFFITSCILASKGDVNLMTLWKGWFKTTKDTGVDQVAKTYIGL